MTNTKTQTTLEQILASLTAIVSKHSKGESVKVANLDGDLAYELSDVVSPIHSGSKPVHFSIDTKESIQNAIRLASDLLEKLANLPPMSESSAFYQMGRNRIPQIFYRPSYLTEEQIERLAIRTEDAIKNDIFCLVPESYVKCLFEDDFDFDRWENLCDEEEEYHEIYQYFFVSDWLGQALAKIGQTVYADDHAYVWGRRTYGQAIDIDCTIQRALSVAFGYETLNQDDEDQNDEDQNDEDQNDLED